MLSGLSRGAAAVGIAGVLVFAVPVTATAYISPVTTGQFVIGAVRAAAPRIAAGSVIGPEGTLIVTSAVAIGALAYATRDTWMPWVSGLLGAGGNQSVDQTALGSPNSRKFLFSPWVVDPAPGGVFSVTVTNTGTTQSSQNNPLTYQCRIGASVSTVNVSGTYWGSLYAGTSKTWSGQCGALATVEYATTVPGSSAAGNNVSWGKSFDAHTDATYSVSSDCIKPDGATATITATTANPGGGGLLVPSCVAAFGPGSRSANFTVSGAQTGGTPKTLATYPQPTDAQTAVLYPNCVGAGVACSYVVRYQGADCTVGAAACVNWTLKELVNPADYSCMYGPYAMPIADCAVAERVYEVNGTRLTEKNTDGDPWTYESPAPAGMPETAPQPGTGTGTVPGTGTGTGTVPGGATGTTPSPAGVPVTNADCWSGGSFSWNPVDWVLTPIKCGLTWAFVPSPATITALKAGVQTDLDRTGVPAVLTAVTVPVAGRLPGDNAGCEGPGVDFSVPGIDPIPVHPFSACAEPLKSAAVITHAVSTVIIVVGGGLGLLRLIGAGLGYNVSLRGGGGESA